MSQKQNRMAEQAPDVRNKNFSEVALGYTAEQAIDEAKRCLSCKNKPCTHGCPVGIDIPRFIEKVAQSDFDGAYDVISMSSSLPAVCGRVCPQETQCEHNCVRGIKGEAVAIGKLERFVADYHAKKQTKAAKPKSNGHRIAVVGSGPAGLSCAGALAKMGYEVTVFEALHTVGGVLAYGIPEFRLPKSIVKQETDELISLGVEIKTNTVIGKTLTLDELFDDFVFNFAANRKLQKSRIVFPLPVYHGKKLTKKIEKKHWKMEHFFMRQDYYTLIFDNQKQMKLMKDTTIDHVVIEKVFYSRKTVQQFVFNRINGQWMMTSICYVPMYQNNNASFLKFYGHFATDTAFQARHIHNPVKFTGPDPDDDFSTMTGDIDPETWPAFAPQLPHGMIYNIIYGQKYTESNRKIFVIRGIANGMETSLTFKKIGGKWELIKLNM